MMVSQGGFGASTSGLGVRRIYEEIFGENGKEAIYPSNLNGDLITSKIPTISSSLAVRG
jgi:penicillin-binding protein 2